MSDQNVPTRDCPCGDNGAEAVRWATEVLADPDTAIVSLINIGQVYMVVAETTTGDPVAEIRLRRPNMSPVLVTMWNQSPFSAELPPNNDQVVEELKRLVSTRRLVGRNGLRHLAYMVMEIENPGFRNRHPTWDAPPEHPLLDLDFREGDSLIRHWCSWCKSRQRFAGYPNVSCPDFPPVRPLRDLAADDVEYCRGLLNQMAGT